MKIKPEFSYSITLNVKIDKKILEILSKYALDTSNEYYIRSLATVSSQGDNMGTLSELLYQCETEKKDYVSTNFSLYELDTITTLCEKYASKEKVIHELHVIFGKLRQQLRDETERLTSDTKKYIDILSIQQ